ncbi:hypothetical protein AB0I28_27170 [Phytomonospora sp. NPDC050363]|uniref:hypothetical protein n=1 Tax=Phytomonospora sp. NPDC050363 TaxID=3155642 RepID=UPI003410C113
MGALIVLAVSMGFFLELLDRGLGVREASVVTGGFVLAWIVAFKSARGVRNLMKAVARS